MSKDTGGKMHGEDLHHAYDAVRVANKSVAFLTPTVVLIALYKVVSVIFKIFITGLQIHVNI